MASAKVLEEKKTVVDEITNKIKDSQSVILFTYQGLTVSELSSLRRELKKVDAEVCVYKNTLVKRALDDMNINLDEYLDGPNAIVFGKEMLEPIKIISKFAKDHENIEIVSGIVNGEVADLNTIKGYASIPSREGLLTMLAGGLIEHVRNLSIALNLYAEQLGEENK